MLHILLIGIVLLFIGVITLINYHKINKHNKEYYAMHENLTNKLTDLNKFIVNKFEKNEKINVYLLNNVVEKLDNIKNDNEIHTTDLNSEITKLKQNLKFLIDNSDLYDEFMGSI